MIYEKAVDGGGGGGGGRQYLVMSNFEIRNFSKLFIRSKKNEFYTISLNIILSLQNSFLFTSREAGADPGGGG